MRCILIDGPKTFTTFITMQIIILILLIIIIIKLFFMSEELNEIKAALETANTKVAAIAADVQRLHDIIAAAGDIPTEEEWNEVKTLANGLNSALQAVDEQTPE